MNRIGCATASLLAAALAVTQTQTPPESLVVPRRLYSAPAPRVYPPPLPRRVGEIAGIPVRIWAPVEPSYSQLADRNRAADPMWTGIPRPPLLPMTG
jgi:hypothetical protein